MDWGTFVAGGGVGAVVVRLLEAYIKHRLDISKADHDEKAKIREEKRQLETAHAEEARRTLLEEQKARAEREESHRNRLIQFENLKQAVLRTSTNHDLIEAYRSLESFFEFCPEYLVCREENTSFRSNYCFSKVSETLDPPKSSNPRLLKKDVNDYATELKEAVKALSLPTLEDIAAFRQRRDKGIIETLPRPGGGGRLK